MDNEGRFISYGNHSYTDYHHKAMNDARGPVESPVSRFHPRFVRSRVSELERGIDPKPKWIEYCKPSCEEEHEVLKRCERGLKIIQAADPEKSCLFRYRQWVECVENCVQPKVFYHLKGANRRGPVDWFKAKGFDGFH
mmetsp:Transcript_7583/g.14222  ORF Transcript_7583/g.14222 Transcript_7583/m.14222 type:complete len:138 (-) Transcript_7583:3695-4108(-)